MTIDEAKKIAEVIRWADGGCSVCVEALVEKANEIFPEFIFEMGPVESIRPNWTTSEDGDLYDIEIPTVSVELKPN